MRKNQFEVRPDLAAYGMLLIRALGPIMILAIGLMIVMSKLAVGFKECALLVAVAASIWFCFLVVGLLRRFYCKILVTSTNGIFEMIETGLFMRREKTWPAGSQFKILKINTLGYLPRIQACDKFDFGQLLSMRQQKELLSWLSEND